MVNATLRFRRHLAACAILLIVREIHLNLSENSKRSRLVRLVSATTHSDEPQQSYIAASRMSFYDNGGTQANPYNSQPASLQQISPNNNNNNNNSPLLEPTLKNEYSPSSIKAPGTIDDDDDDYDFITDTLAFIGYYLPTLNFNYSLNSLAIGRKQYEQLDQHVENYFTENFSPNISLDELQLMSVKAAMRLAPLPLHTSWGYETHKDLSLSSWPVSDESRCAAHLNQLAARLDRLGSSGPLQASVTRSSQPELALAGTSNPNELPRLGASHQASPVENFEAQLLYRTTDIQLMRYLDTFGHVPDDVLRGNVHWYGSYEGCLDTKLKANQQMGGTKRIKMRYCLVALKSINWKNLSANQIGISLNRDKSSSSTNIDGSTNNNYRTEDGGLQNFFLRLGACLPESCDSRAFDYQSNVANIEKLVKFNLMKPYNSDHYYLADLYCLPDHRSPVRSIPLMGKLFLLLILGWLGLITLATTVHLNVERFYRETVRKIRLKQERESVIVFSGDGGGGGGDQTIAELNTSLHDKRYLENDSYMTGATGGGPPDSTMQTSITKNNSNNKNNQFKESDIFHLKHNWVRLNIYVFDLGQNLIPGIDLIACLSLYSNWLKYTNRLKLAVAELHADEQRRERARLRARRIVDDVRVGGSAAKLHLRRRLAPTVSDNQSSGSGQRLTDSNSSNEQLALASAQAQSGTNIKATNQQQEQSAKFESELVRCLKEQDEADELESEQVKRRVDTSSLNALKVISLFWIIAGHSIFYLASNIADGAILKNYVRDLSAFALANGAMYITEIFFVITGCLTSYLAFKYNTFKLKKTTPDETQPLGEQQQQQQQENAQVEIVYMESRMFRVPFWICICINRYLRILPTYLVVYSFIKLVTVYIGGKGPVWDYAVSENSMRRKCLKESWWPVISLTSNFVSIFDHCIVGGWYLSVDMQFMIMAVPLLILLAYSQKRRFSKTQHFVAFNNRKQQQQPLTFINSTNNNNPQSGDANQDSPKNRSPKFEAWISKRVYGSYAIICGLGLLSALLAMYYGIYVKDNIDLSIILKFVPHAVALLSRNIDSYTNSIFRFRAFAFGMILGHLLYLYEFKLIKLPKFIQQHGAKLTTIVFSIGFCIMFLPVIYPAKKIIVSHDMTVIFMILTAGGVDIFLCALVFLICIGKAPKIVLFLLNSPFWSVLSSLSLCAFLIHSEIIILITSHLDPPPKIGYYLLFLIFCATLITTYTLALGLYLSFEMPISRLVNGVMFAFLNKWKPVMSENPSALPAG